MQTILAYAIYFCEVLAVFVLIMSPALVKFALDSKNALPMIICNALVMTAMYNIPATVLNGFDLTSICGIATGVVSFACTSVLCIIAVGPDEEALNG